ncbi:MAG: PD40 domain-containing protein [Anaerolineae bacterium]|nr:PD40 domain-containing protein [Anaerolineae bacterium]
MAISKETYFSSMREVKIRSMVGVMCLLLVGCASGSGSITPPGEANQPIDAASPSAVPVTVTPTSTIEPSPPATESPSVIDATATPVPENGLLDNGPILIFKAAGKPDGEEHLWAVNQDGSNLTQLVDENVLNFAVHPHSSLTGGITIVYAMLSEQGASNITLKLLALPGGDVETITPLVGETLPVELYDMYSLTQSVQSGGLVWSPGGTLLAFVGMLDDSWANLYTYDYAEGVITRLSNQPHHALHPQWSPDGRFIVYGAVEFFLMGSAQTTGMWASKYDGTGLAPLEGPLRENGERGYYTEVVAWLNNTELLLRSAHFYPMGYVLHADAETGATSMVFNEPFIQAAYALEYNTWLLSQANDSEASISLILYQYGERTELLADNVGWVWWSGDYDVFFGVGDDKRLYTITPRGKISELPLENGWYSQFSLNYIFSVSPDGSRWAWHYPGDSGMGGPIWVGEPMKQPIHLVSAGTSTNQLYLSWTPDSRRIICLTDAGLYMAEAPDFQIAPVSTNLFALHRADWGGVWVH